MKFIYGNKEVNLQSGQDKKISYHCLKAELYRLEELYKNMKKTQELYKVNFLKKRFFDNKQLAEHEGKRAFEEMF
jgi:hypothetical protein